MGQDPKVLLVRPLLENPEGPRSSLFESHCFSMGVLVKKEVLDSEYRVIDLAAYSATRMAVELALTQLYENIQIVVFLGHGDRSGRATKGQRMEPCIDEQNIYMCDGMGCYFICCHCARVLGRTARDKGVKFFIGFADKFYMTPHGTEWIISHCALYGLYRLIRGDSPVDAWFQTQREHERWIEKLETEQDDLDPDWFVAAAVLKANLAALRLMQQGGDYYV